MRPHSNRNAPLPSRCQCKGNIGVSTRKLDPLGRYCDADCNTSAMLHLSPRSPKCCSQSSLPTELKHGLLKSKRPPLHYYPNVCKPCSHRTFPLTVLLARASSAQMYYRNYVREASMKSRLNDKTRPFSDTIGTGKSPPSSPLSLKSAIATSPPSS
jgi:hypothetical protein